jgi:hypothetical protein
VKDNVCGADFVILWYVFPPIFSKHRLTKFLACQESRFTVVERVTTQSEGVSEEEEDRGGQRGYS